MFNQIFWGICGNLINLSFQFIYYYFFLQPILLTKFPAGVKSFYMQKDKNDPRVVEAVRHPTFFYLLP